MKKTVLLFIFALLCIPNYLNAYGFGTHARHFDIIKSLNLPGSYLALIESPYYKPYFIYGSIFPDIQYAVNYKNSLGKLEEQVLNNDNKNVLEGLTYKFLVDKIPDNDYVFGFDTHHDKYGLAFAEYLFTQAGLTDPPGPDPGLNGKEESRNRKIAFALGYYAHLAEDIACHNFLVPRITAQLDLGDFELVRNSSTFTEDPNSQTEAIIETMLDYTYGNNNLVANTVYWDIWIDYNQYEPTLAQMDPFNWTYQGEFYDPAKYGSSLNPVINFFNTVVNDWYSNNPYSLPTNNVDKKENYRMANTPLSLSGLSQLATLFRFVNRFYPALVGKPYDGKNSLPEVFSEWIYNHLNYKDGYEGVLVLLDIFGFREPILRSLAYPSIQDGVKKDMGADVRIFLSLMLSDINEATKFANEHPDIINISEFERLKCSAIFTNPGSILEEAWNQYSTLGAKIYSEVGPDGKWYSDWSPWHSQSMAWGALTSLNKKLTNLYSSNPDVAVYDAFIKVGTKVIKGYEDEALFRNNPITKAYVELYNTKDVNSKSMKLQVKKDHTSNNYAADSVITSGGIFSIDQNPFNYNSISRIKKEIQFNISPTDLLNYNGYYYELVDNSNNKPMFTSSFEQYAKNLPLTSNYLKIYDTYTKWPVSLGVAQNLCQLNLANPVFSEGGTSEAYYTINGIPGNSQMINKFQYANIEVITEGDDVFVEWSDGNRDNPRIIQLDSNLNISAKIKIPQISNNQSAFSNSGSINFLRGEEYNGNAINSKLIYESMGKVWFETKSTYGQWQFGNSRKPLNNGDVVMDASFDPNARQTFQYVIYQHPYGLRVDEFDDAGNYQGKADVAVYQNYNDTYRLKPVIVSTIAGRVMAVWKEADGLYYRFGCYTPSNPEKIFWYVEPVWIDGTDGNSDNPTIAAGRVADLNNAIFHIAWQQGTSKIIRKSYKINNTTAFNTISDWGASQVTATGAGCSSVKSPVITVNPGNNAEYRLAFIGYKAGSDKAIALFNNQYSAFGSTVTSIGINCIDNKSVIAFSDNGTGMVGRVAEVYYYGSPIKHTGTIGKIKMSPAVSKANASVMALNTNSLPYSFNKSNALSLLKASDIKTGKEGIIAKGDAAVYFRLGDIESDGLSIEFDNKPDSIGAKTAEDIAERTTTLPFTINDASKLKFSVYYGALDSAKAYSALSETDKAEFEAELIDSETKEVLGSFEKTAFTKTNLSSYEKINYIVNTEGIGARKVRLRLKAKSNFGETVSISNIYEESGIQKQDEGVTKQAALNSDAVVKEYALEQNYPNPFNPATTIRYALPKDGAVRLTIYNLLGQEVTTLVNEYKLKGRYEVKFDASNLSSGMYIYRLKSGSFSDSKRMMLVK